MHNINQLHSHSVTMPQRTTIVLSDNYFTVKTGSRELFMDDCTKMCGVHGENRTSAAASHGFGANGNVPDARDRTTTSK